MVWDIEACTFVFTLRPLPGSVILRVSLNLSWDSPARPAVGQFFLERAKESIFEVLGTAQLWHCTVKAAIDHTDISAYVQSWPRSLESMQTHNLSGQRIPQVSAPKEREHHALKVYSPATGLKVGGGLDRSLCISAPG